MVVCPNFGHHALTSSCMIYFLLQVKNSFSTIMNGLSVLKLFQLLNGHSQVRKPNILGQGVEVRAHYPATPNRKLVRIQFDAIISVQFKN